MSLFRRHKDRGMFVDTRQLPGTVESDSNHWTTGLTDDEIAQVLARLQEPSRADVDAMIEKVREDYHREALDTLGSESASDERSRT